MHSVFFYYHKVRICVQSDSSSYELRRLFFPISPFVSLHLTENFIQTNDRPALISSLLPVNERPLLRTAIPTTVRTLLIISSKVLQVY